MTDVGSAQTERLVARVLAGSWRADAPIVDLTAEELTAVEPLLTGSGAAALGWRAVRRVPRLADHPTGLGLRDSARLLAINDSLRQRALEALASQFNTAGLTPMIFKGWAAGRHYAEPHLRPYGDIDLIIPAEEIAAARGLLAQLSTPPAVGADPDVFIVSSERGGWSVAVDVHSTLPGCYATPIAPLFARAAPMTLANGATLLLPCAEDHLRMVVGHLLRHGAWRPLWLCDVAAMAENAGPEFDWPLCLTDDPVTRGWIEATVALSRQLLGARVNADLGCPGWFSEGVLKEWRAPYAWRAMPPSGAEFSDALAALKAKWPNAVRAGFLAHVPVTAGLWPLRQLAFLLGVEIPRASQRLLDPSWWRRLLGAIMPRKSMPKLAGRAV